MEKRKVALHTLCSQCPDASGAEAQDKQNNRMNAITTNKLAHELLEFAEFTTSNDGVEYDKYTTGIE